MRIGIVGFFDIGRSYGLDDEVFVMADRAPAPDIGLVGINFPLGQGVRLELSGPVLDAWRTAARKQVRRPEMETGWSKDLGLSRTDFDDELERLVARHPITRCELRVHAVGTVFVELAFGPGIPRRYWHGVPACFEFAAYTPGMADMIYAAAERRAEAALLPDRRGLVALSERELPAIQHDSKGYEERPLFTGFSRVIACIHDGDDREVAAALDAEGLKPDDAIEFEYHGKLYYDWATCVLEPKALYDWREKGEESPEHQVMRMEADIRVAHVFLGTCAAFTRLCTSEIHGQVGGYVGATQAGRPPEALNRLRTLALAVVNLTDFNQVAEADEDRAYFARFSADAGIERKQRTIQEATETLYNVQVADLQRDDARRQWTLSVIVGLLTSLTLISVTADAYDFLRQEDRLIESQSHRGIILAVELLLIMAILVAFVTMALRAPRRRR
jgi:hypothetical protein